jgi:hypothetical protein
VPIQMLDRKRLISLAAWASGVDYWPSLSGYLKARFYSRRVSGFSAFRQFAQQGISLCQVTSRICAQNGQWPDHS